MSDLTDVERVQSRLRFGEMEPASSYDGERWQKARDAFDRIAARLAAAEQALREIAAHEVMDETEAQPCDWHCSGGMAARAALALREETT